MKYTLNNDELNLVDGTIKVIYNDESTDSISLTNELVKVTGFDNSSIGMNNLTVEYNGHILNFEVEIVSKQSIGIELEEKPEKIRYIQNYEELDLTVKEEQLKTYFGIE